MSVSWVSLNAASRESLRAAVPCGLLQPSMMRSLGCRLASLPLRVIALHVPVMLNVARLCPGEPLRLPLLQQQQLLLQLVPQRVPHQVPLRTGCC